MKGSASRTGGLASTDAPSALARSVMARKRLGRGLSHRSKKTLRNLFIAPMERGMDRAARGVPPQTIMRGMGRDIARSRVGKGEVAHLFAEMLTEIKIDPRPTKAVTVPQPTTGIEIATCSLFDALDAQMPYGTSL